MELLTEIYEEVNPLELGYSHRGDFAWSVLGISNRSWQAQARLWKTVRSLPLTRQAYADGLLSDAKLTILLTSLTPDNEATWLRRSVRLGPDKLRRLVDQIRETSALSDAASRSQASSHAEAPSAAGTAPLTGAPAHPGTTCATSSGDSPHLEAWPHSNAPLHSNASPFSENLSDNFTDRPADFVVPSGSTASRPDAVQTVASAVAADQESEPTPRLALPCPLRTYWTCEAFAQEVSRRIGHRASTQDWVDVAAASFLAGTTPDRETDIVRRVHWPPLFLTDNPGRSGQPSIPLESSNKLPDLDAYVCRTDGNPVEAAGPWLQFWRKEAAQRGVPEPQPGDEGWAFFQGISPHETDGFNFVTGGPESRHDTETKPTVSDHGRESALRATLRDRLEKIIASCSAVTGASAAGSGSGFGSDPDSAGSPIPLLIRKFRETEATIRVLSRQRLRCLRQIRLDRSYYTAGFSTFDDFVEHRIRTSGRTAHRWLREPDISRTLELAEADPRLSTQAVRQLERLESAGADEQTLQMWVQRALRVPLKDFRGQVDWALAQEDLALAGFSLDKLIPGGSSLNEIPRFEPPPAAAWIELSKLLKKDPHLIGCSAFHQAARGVHAESVSQQLGESPSSAADSAGTSRTISARLAEAASPTVTIPDPAEPTPRSLYLYLTNDSIDNLARTFAILRAQYGQDKPDWWCLEVLLLHVLAGWSDEDTDFRRRTREFSTLARDGFQCQNPCCTARRNLTVHHIVFRSAQGSDAADNKVTLCAACHLQGVHHVRSIRVTGTAPDELTWHIGRGDWKVIIRHGEIVKVGKNWDL